MHSYLSAHDYHRFHVPVRGVVREVRNIPGRVILDVIKKEDGSLDMTDGDTYQLTQQRGLIIIESPLSMKDAVSRRNDDTVVAQAIYWSLARPDLSGKELIESQPPARSPEVIIFGR